jgi:hypothetical protein
MFLCNKSSNSSAQGIPIFELWKKYEDSMHFNDLLIKLRFQSLAGVVAASTITATFKNQSYKITAGNFALLIIFWFALWVLDSCYYNRLLFGAVSALIKLENLTKEKTHIISVKRLRRSCKGSRSLMKNLSCLGGFVEDFGFMD